MQSEREIRPQRPRRRSPRKPWPSNHRHSLHPYLPRNSFCPSIPSYFDQHRRNSRGNQRRLPSLQLPDDCLQLMQHHRSDHRPKNKHRTGKKIPIQTHQQLHRSPSWNNPRYHGQTIRYVKHCHATIAHRCQIEIRNNDLRPLPPHRQLIHRHKRLRQHGQSQWIHLNTSSADQHWPCCFNVRFNISQRRPHMAGHP